MVILHIQRKQPKFSKIYKCIKEGIFALRL
jgi:hypothetical protein